MSPRVCKDCDRPEERRQDANGHETVNINPLTGRCVDCEIRASQGLRTFHSRRDDRQGEVIDTKKRQGNDA